MGPPLLDRTRVQVVVVDVQEAFRGRIDGFTTIARRAAFLIGLARRLELPCATLVQAPERLGPAAAEVVAALADREPIAKATFNAMATPQFTDALDDRRDQVLLAGVEAHICVLQTALGLIAGGRVVFLALDAIGSQRGHDAAVAIDRLLRAGAVPVTSESVAFEILATAEHPAFRGVLELVKEQQGFDAS